jgi:hypothetical protein
VPESPPPGNEGHRQSDENLGRENIEKEIEQEKERQAVFRSVEELFEYFPNLKTELDEILKEALKKYGVALKNQMTQEESLEKLQDSLKDDNPPKYLRTLRGKPPNDREGRRSYHQQTVERRG